MSAMLYEFLHNCVAHPAMFFSRNAKWAMAFHDSTAKKAWPR